MAVENIVWPPVKIGGTFSIPVRGFWRRLWRRVTGRPLEDRYCITSLTATHEFGLYPPPPPCDLPSLGALSPTPGRTPIVFPRSWEKFGLLSDPKDWN